MSTQIPIITNFQLFQGTGKPFQYRTKELHIDLEPGDALVKILLSTICGSDVHTIDGLRKEETPCILGHEAVGEIVAINARDGFDIGDRVTWSIADSCGQCMACTEHRLPEKCHKLFKYGHVSINNGSGLNGCYASHIHIRTGTHMVKVPNSVPNSVAAPANCALATMVNAVSYIAENSRNVVIQGGGLLGLYACSLLSVMGISRIFCLEINQERLGLIPQFGAVAVDARDPEAAAKLVLDQVAGGVDTVIEVAGSKKLIPQGVNLLRPGGGYLLVGLVHPDSELNITGEQIIRKCLYIKGVHNYSPWHLDEAVAFLEQISDRFPFESLVSPPYQLDQLEQAVGIAKRQKWARVAIQPNL